MPKFSPGRRRFTLGAAAVATTALVRPAETLAQTGAANTLDAKTRAAMSRLSAQAQAEVEMKVNSIFRKYGDRLSDEQKSDIRRIMAESQEGLEKLRAYPLDNSNQPADAFRAYREEKASEPKPRAKKTAGEKK